MTSKEALLQRSIKRPPRFTTGATRARPASEVVPSERRFCQTAWSNREPARRRRACRAGWWARPATREPRPGGAGGRSARCALD